MSNKPALGKGLNALFNAESEAAETPGGKINKSGDGVLLLSVNKIQTTKGQPRKTFDQDSLDELAESIKSKGVLQPILVEMEGSGYKIIAGERRFRASLQAGLKEIPAIIKSFTPAEKLEVALIENIQREDLNPLEEALAYKDIMDAARLSQEEVARKVGKKRSTVANSLRLLHLDKEMQKALVSGDLTPGHARAILSLENPADRKVLFNRIVSSGMSVREAEKTAAELSKGKRSKAAKKQSVKNSLTPELRQIEQHFIDVFGTKVKIKGDNNKGQIEISYLSMEDLERIMDILI